MQGYWQGGVFDVEEACRGKWCFEEYHCYLHLAKDREIAAYPLDLQMQKLLVKTRTELATAER